MLFLCLVLASCGGPDAGSREAKRRILWDRYGIPHIFASDSTSLFRAFGWAQMESHANLILRLYGESRGRAAEYWGPSHLESDRRVWTLGIPDLARRWLERQRTPYRGFLEAFVAGMNDYAARHPEAIEAKRARVLPLEPADVLAHLLRTVHFTFVSRPARLERARRRWVSAGSNAWVVAPARSRSGHTLLLANPHLPWSGLDTFYEAQLVAPGIDIYGALLVGSPFISIGFNDHLGWTHTVNTHDGADLYELHLEGDGYLWDGEVRPFRKRRVRLRVRRPDGSPGQEELVVEESVQGPVLARRGDRALALRVVGLDRPHLLEEYWRMGRAHNLEEFEQALRMLQMPMFTVMYGDGAGHILHLFGGLTPRRSPGDWNWSGIVPGDTSATLWTETHPYSDLPRVLDPASHWLQNANDPPWTTTFPAPLDPDRYPPYMAPRFMHLRAQRSAKLLARPGKLTLEEMIRRKFSTRVELADRILEDVLALAPRDALARRALGVLERWDRRADETSRGAVLFEAFVRAYRRRARPFYARPWRQDQPLQTPWGLGDPEVARAALAKAARTVRKRYGALDVPWGRVKRFRLGGLDLPANGGPGSLGIFRVIEFTPDPDGREHQVAGDSFIAALEFSQPVRARALLAYGNASQPGSPHRSDQLELAREKRLRPVWRTYRKIEAHLERREEVP